MRTKTPNFEFGEFLLDTGERVLLCDGKPLSITPKAFQLLQVLVENQGHIVEKDELMKLVWADSFVEEGNLTFTVNLLRKLMEEDAKNPRFIETVPRRGYRFIARVRKVVDEEIDVQDTLIPPETVQPQISSNFNLVVERVENVAAFTEGQNAAEKDIDRGSEAKRVLRLVLKVLGLRGFLWTSVFLLAVVLAGVRLGWHYFGDSGRNITGKKISRLTSNGKIKAAAVSPDGKFIAYVVEDKGRFGLWLKNIVAGGNDLQILPPVENVELGNITFSPESGHIYYSAENTLYQIPILGGLPKLVIQNFFSATSFHERKVTFSPDGKQLAFLRDSMDSPSTALIIANADGSAERVLARSERPNIFRGSPAWSPNGDVIALCALGANAIMGAVTVQVANGVVSPLPLPGLPYVYALAWGSDGNALFAIGSEDGYIKQIWSLSYPGGQVRNITNDFNSYESFSVTVDGHAVVAVMSEQKAHIWVMSSGEESGLRQITHTGATVLTVSKS